MTETQPYVAERAQPPADGSQALPQGFRLDEFEIRDRLGEGGFGIVYAAWDHSLGQMRAIKEYMPAGIAQRDPGGSAQVVPRGSRYRETFDKGLQRFIEEAQTLARFDHPSLLRVLRRWEAHGTAYMAMPLYEGSTLRETVRGLPERPSETWLMQLLAPLTEALAVVHRNRWLHRDIAPDNIFMLRESARPLLLDFGAARQVIGDVTQELTAILKPGFAPVEQYGETPGLEQGPWTDVYALAATMHWCLLGRPPAASVSRVLVDNQQPMVQSAAGLCSERFLAALDKALRVDARQRTQSMAELRADLGLAPLETSVPVTQTLAATVQAAPSSPVVGADAGYAPTVLATQRVGTPLPGDPQQRTEKQTAAQTQPERTELLSRTEALDRTVVLPREALAGAGLGGVEGGTRPQGAGSASPSYLPVTEQMSAPHRAFEPVVMTLAQPAPQSAAHVLTAASSGSGNRRSALIVAGVAGGLLLAAAAIYLTRERTPTPATELGTRSAATPAVVTQPPSELAPAASAPAVPAPVAAAPTLEAQWQAVLDGADLQWAPVISGAPASISVSKQELLRFELRAPQDGYLTLLLRGPDGSLTRLLANQAPLRVKAGQTIALPPAGSDRLQASEPLGEEQLLAIVSPQPRDHAHLAAGREASFETLRTDATTLSQAAMPGDAPVLTGRAAAGCQGEACRRYGAARLVFRVVP